MIIIFLCSPIFNKKFKSYNLLQVLSCILYFTRRPICSLIYNVILYWEINNVYNLLNKKMKKKMISININIIN